MLTLYHCVSARSFRPLWMLEELQAPYTLKMLPFPPRARERSFLSVNVLGTVPFLEDQEAGVAMTESAAMCQYLAETLDPTNARGLHVKSGEPDYAAYLNWLHHGEATLTFPQTIALRYGRLEPPERQIPQAADDYTKWFLARLRAIDALLARTREAHPALVDWVARSPLRALAVSTDWGHLLAAHAWLVESAGQGRHLREVTAPGVDTKFIEGHTRVLGEWLDATVAFDPRHSAARRFARRYGFAEAPQLLRLRVDAGLGVLPPGVSEVGLRVAEAGALAVAPSQVLIVENLTTYLAVPVPEGGVVVWGQGFDAGRLGRMPWLGVALRVRYWGDLDTHGFAILDLVRSQVPQVTSVLMDLDTLLHHRSRWVPEPKQTRADLVHLTGGERALYEDLVEDVHGPSVRLEQERIDWAWVLERL